MPGARCAICNNSYVKTRKDTSKRVVYHDFPSDLERQRKWMALFPQAGNWNTKSCHICSDHFREGDYELPSRKILKKIAVPSLLLDAQDLQQDQPTMPGTCCAVASCNNTHAKTRKDTSKRVCYHKFPSDLEQQRKWIHLCRRAANWKARSCRICSDHFREEDYERNLQAEMLNIPSKKILKNTAVPSLLLGAQVSKLDRSTVTVDQQSSLQERGMQQQLVEGAECWRMETTAKNRNYKWCFVPKCTSTSKTTPEKIFICLPKGNERKKWLRVSKRIGKISLTSSAFCCEDHFDMSKDIDNWIRYSLMGGRIKLKPGTLPHKFECHKVLMASDASKRQAERAANKKRKSIVKEAMLVFELSQNVECSTKDVMPLMNVKREPLDEGHPEKLDSYEVDIEVKQEPLKGDQPETLVYYGVDMEVKQEPLDEDLTETLEYYGVDMKVKQEPLDEDQPETLEYYRVDMDVTKREYESIYGHDTSIKLKHELVNQEETPDANDNFFFVDQSVQEVSREAECPSLTDPHRDPLLLPSNCHQGSMIEEEQQKNRAKPLKTPPATVAANYASISLTSQPDQMSTKETTCSYNNDSTENASVNSHA